MRLIDEEHFIENIRLYLNRSSVGEITSQTEISMGELASLLKDEPTAYDVNNVVAGLYSVSKDVSRGFLGKDGTKYHKHYKAVKLSKAIKILNQGGTHND